MSGPLILAEGIGKTFPSGSQHLQILSDIDLRIDHGEMVAIMGPSGSGKSTLLNILGCLDRPTAGDFRFAGSRVQDLSVREIAALRNQRIGFVFQGFNLLPRLTAAENIELPLVYAGLAARKRRERSAELIARMGLAGRAHHFPQQLSGGQQQRVAIARALVNRPVLLFADEPTGALDSQSGQAILTLFKRLNQAGVTLIMVTHDRSVAWHARRIVRLRDGRIVSDQPNPKPEETEKTGDPARPPGREREHASGIEPL